MCTLPGLRDIKKEKVLLFLFLVTIATEVFAQFPAGAFWKRRIATLRFSSVAQTLYAKNCSGAVTLKTYNSSGIQASVASDTTVTLSASPTSTFYSDNTCTNTITNATILAGNSSVTFYFIDTSAGTNNITATATGFPQVSQTETITANPYIWTGGGANANWSTAANWSGNAVPGTSNTAVFDGSCISNCSPLISANTTVGGIRLNSDYAGTLTQNAGVTLTINGNYYVQLGGSFVGGTANFSIYSSFKLMAGNFTSTTATLYVQAPTSVDFNSGATFNHNSGTVSINFWNVGSAWNLTGTPVFNTFSMDTGCGASAAITGSMTVNGILNIHSGCGIGLNGGTINVKGDVNINEIGASGTTILNISGSGNQTITAQNAYQPNTPDIVIASTGGTVKFVNRLYMSSFTYTSGTLDMSASTLYFGDRTRVLTFIPGNANIYNNVTWEGGCQAGFILTGTLNMTGTLNFPGGCSAKINGGGTINLTGNLAASSRGANGNIKIYMNGNSNQSITGGVDVNVLIPYVEIASTGGTVSFLNTFAFSAGFKYTSGTVDTSASNVFFYDSSSYQNTIIPGSMEFTNVYWYGDCNSHLALTGTMIVKGTLTMGGGCPASVTGGGKMLAYGNVNLSWVGGNSQIEFTGPASTTLSGGSGTPSGNITVSKTGGATLTLAGNISFNNTGQSFDVVSGAVDLAGKNLTLKALTLNGNTLTKNAGVLTVNGATAGTGSLYGGTVSP